MRSFSLLSSASVISLALITQAAAQVSQQCPETDICYSLNVPADTASSGNGDIYFQIQASTKYQWIGFGQGSQMAGSNIFILYTDATGTNVTLSPRSGLGEYQPLSDTTAQFTLLDGTGVSDGNMTANVRCSNCQSWQGGKGTMDFTGSSTTWIHSYKTGAELKTNDVSESLEQHDLFGILTFDKSAAAGGASTNPFVVAEASPSSPSSPSSALSTAISSTATDTATPDSDFSYGSLPFGGSIAKKNAVTLAHGIMASLAFVIFFPIGAILVRLGKFNHLARIHAAIQTVGLMLFISAFGLGIYLAQNLDFLKKTHPIIGMVLFALVLLQPLLGLVHHFLYRKHHRRFIWTHAHLWLGRILITLGIVNGGLGLRLAQNYTTGESIAYAVVGAFVWIVYMCCTVFGEMRRSKEMRHTQPSQVALKDEALHGSSNEKL